MKRNMLLMFVALPIVMILAVACGGSDGASRAVDLATPGAAGETAYTNLYSTNAVISNDLTVNDDLSVLGDFYVDKFAVLDAATAISVTAGATITPLQSYQPLQSGGVVTTSTSTAVANGATTGQLLILVNTNASDAITIDGAGGNVECGGDKALGKNDALTLVWNGADWVCVMYQNN